MVQYNYKGVVFLNNQIKTIDITDSKIEFTLPAINYDFTELKQQALELQGNLENVVVTIDTVKSNKKLVAQLNKTVTRLEDERKLVKNELLVPYLQLELDIKEIVGIIKDTDELIRLQIRRIEEEERVNKEIIIHELFEKRSKLYDLDDFIQFKDFLSPAHSNKSTSLTVIEQDIVSYFERIKDDINTIKVLQNKDKVLQHYLSVKSLSVAIQNAQIEEDRAKQVEAIKESSNVIKDRSEPPREPKYTIVIEGDENLKFLQLFMQQNGIEYKVL